MERAQSDDRDEQVAASTSSRVGALLDRERPAVLHTAAIAVVALAIEFAVRAVARIPPGRLGDGSLTLAAARSNVPLVVVGLLGLLAIGRFGRRGLGLRWTDLEQGGVLRAVAGLAVVLLVWRHVTIPHDFLFGQWRLLDRAVLVVSAALALWRPLGLLAALVSVRVMMQPMLEVLSFTSGQNIDRVLLLVVAIVAALAVVAMVSGETRSAPVLVLLVALFAAQFFVPGRAKLDIGWLGLNDLRNMAPNGYAQGWLGSGDGGFSRRLADAMQAFEPLLGPATLVLELGAIAAVLHRRAAMAWLVGFAGFHTVVAAAFGFSFLDWVLVEVVLVVLLLRSSLRPWVTESFRPGSIAVALALVVTANWVLRPPPLSWIDGPVTYRYDIDATDAAGQTWAIESAAFEPYDGAFAFGMLPLGPTVPVAAGYGATAASEARALRSVDTFEELAELEASFGPGPTEARRDEVVWVLQRFMLSTENGPRPWLPGPPRHFSTSRPGPNYDGKAPIVRLDVVRVTVLRTDAGELRREEDVLTIERDGEQFTLTMAS